MAGKRLAANGLTTALVLGLGALVAGCSGGSSGGGGTPTPTGQTAAAPAPSQPSTTQAAPNAPTATSSGGSSSSSPAPAAPTNKQEGQLQILIHDGPTPAVDQVLVTIDRVEVESVSQGWLTVSTDTQTIDLLALQDGVVAELGLATLPAGDYGQIRMHVTDAKVVLPGGQEQPLKIPSGGQSGLKIVSGFTVPAGGTLTLTLDWDVGTHLHHNKGQGWILRPTITVESAVVTNPCLTITFADPNLEAVVRTAISKPTGPITDVDVAGLTALAGSGKGITDLRGIECLTDLTIVSLGENQITDLSPLAGLTSITVLNIRGNPNLVDLTPLAGLINVTSLLLTSTDVADLTPLAGLVQLQTLQLPDNSRITSIAPLAGLVNMRHLLLRQANLGGDISAVSNMTLMHDLTLNGVGITNADLAALSNMSVIYRLSMDSSAISNLTVIGGLTTLNFLVLRGNQIVNTGPLANLTNLQGLAIGGSLVTGASVAPIGQLTQLTTLAIFDTPTLDSIQNLSGLINLTRLEVRSAQLNGDISAVANMTQLTTLRVNGTGVTNATVGALAGLNQLSQLRIGSTNLGTNNVSDLTVIGSLPALSLLEIRGNGISDLTPLIGSPVSTLIIDSNQISNASPLLTLTGLTRLTISNNPIACNDPDLTALSGQGVTVSCQ